MKIVIDISQIAYKGTGVARYTKTLVDSLIKYDQTNDYTFFFSSLRQRLDRHLEEKIKKNHILKKIPLPPITLDFLWNRLHFVPIETITGRFDLLLTSDWTEPPSRYKKMTVVHDLVYLKYPQTLHPKIVAVQRRRLAWVRQESELIIADSLATKKDLVELLKIPEKKITVVYPAVEVKQPREKAIKNTLDKFGLQKPFILTVGKIEPRKNLTRLIKAFLTAKLKNIDLIVVGLKGWDKTMEQYNNLTIKNSNIRFLGYVSDKELYSLYQSAFFFVYPSLYEGFGYPIVEAMKLGCPVATSNTSSLKEIGQGSALLFDPNSTEQIKEAILTLTANKSLRKNLMTKGRKKASLFKEENFAKKIIKVFEKAYGNRS